MNLSSSVVPDCGEAGLTGRSASPLEDDPHIMAASTAGQSSVKEARSLFFLLLILHAYLKGCKSFSVVNFSSFHIALLDVNYLRMFFTHKSQLVKQ